MSCFFSNSSAWKAKPSTSLALQGSVQWCSVAQGGEPCCAALLQALQMQQFLLSLEQPSKPSSRDLCDAEDSDETTVFTKTKKPSNTRKGKTQQSKFSGWGHWAAESSCFKTIWLCHLKGPQWSPLCQSPLGALWAQEVLEPCPPLPNGVAVILLWFWFHPYMYRSTTNLKLFFQHLLFCWLFVKSLCWSVQCFPLLFVISALAELCVRGCLLC